MPEPISFGELSFEIVSSMDDTQATPEPETPFRIGLLGEFSGRASRTHQTIKQLKPIMVDRDNLDEVLNKLGVEVHLSLADNREPLIITFEELEDFHPDNLFQRLEIFQSLRQLRRELNEPETFPAAASRVRSWLQIDEPDAPSEAARETTAQPQPDTQAAGSLLDQIVSESSGQASVSLTEETDESEFDGFLREIVTPHLVADEDPQLQQLVSLIDTAITQVMEAILHHPEFQAIEAAWRGVDFLTSRLETGVELKLYLFDISKEELAEDLRSSDDLSATVLCKHFVEQSVETFGGVPWALLTGNYIFEQNLADIQILGRLAKIAHQAGAPFISGAGEQLLGCESLSEMPNSDDWRLTTSPDIAKAWNMLRHLPEASSIGLALPRFLLRLPYGADTDETDTFDFEEMGSPPEHTDYLWGNGAIACACLLGCTFSRSGWQMRPGELQEISGLPLHVYKKNDESKIKPCAEVVFTQKSAEIILDKGFMPLLSFLNQDTVRLARFQSIAEPLTHLAGRWG